MSQQNKLIIDVDRVIESYNKKNPEKLPMTRKRLAEKLGMNTQIFSDWKRGKTPKWTYHLMKMIEVGECDVDEFIIMAE